VFDRSRRFGLDINLPRTAELVEIVNEQAAHKCLNGLVHIVDRNPCLSTLSRSTLMYSSGTLGINVESDEADSGRLRAAARNLFRLSLRNSTSLPERFFQDELKPRPVPTPGTAGGEKLKTVPTGNPLSSWFSRFFIS